MADGVIRIGILLVYLFALSRPKDMRRIFEYHGAEHKVRLQLRIRQTAQRGKCPEVHHLSPRCGTCFLLVMLVIAMLVNTRFCHSTASPPSWWRAIALLPLTIGLSYELIRFAAKRQGTLMGMLTRPGLWLQRITTQPPDDSQAAVRRPCPERRDGAGSQAGRHFGRRVTSPYSYAVSSQTR